MIERIISRGRQLAHVAWKHADNVLARVPRPLLPARTEFRGLEEQLGRALSAAEETTFVHAYRSELHSLNAEFELALLVKGELDFARRRQP